MRKILLLSSLLVMFVFLVSCAPQEGAVAGEAVAVKKSLVVGATKLKTNLCGDGRTDFDNGEECDGEVGCSSACKLEEGVVKLCESIKSCGNGIVDRDKGEQCDDGNLRNGDGCSRVCRYEKDVICGDMGLCGDGNLDANEECDDGNIVSNDGCSRACKLEQVGVTNLCGNGKMEGTERCDDGNIVNGDGCSSVCVVETGSKSVTTAPK